METPRAMFVIVFACLLSPCDAASFLASTEGSDFLTEFAKAERAGSGLRRLPKYRTLAAGHVVQAVDVTHLEKLLRPMCMALPKTHQGKLGYASVRYALNRFFAQHHVWFIKGLDHNTKGAWNISSLGSALSLWVPQYVLDAFEQRMAREGLNLHELAILVAELRHAAQNVASADLFTMYRARHLSTDRPLNQRQASETLLTYMMRYMYVDNAKVSEWSLDKIDRELYDEGDPLWNEMKVWTNDAYNNEYFRQKDQASPFASESLDFDDAARLVASFGEHFGQWHGYECRALKSAMVDLEYRGTGRARLFDYYSAEMSGTVPRPFHFDETLESLRLLGVIDESDSENPSIIIPNFMLARANCHASSRFYDTCCVDECEDLMSHIEKDVALPMALPSQIAKLVESLPSDTVDAPRSLSPSLVKRLNEIADMHDGWIPLHSRMFAQWMHHAYPRECPFPRVGSSDEVIDTPEVSVWKGGGDLIMPKTELLKFAPVNSSTNDTLPAGPAFDKSDVQVLALARSSRAGLAASGGYLNRTAEDVAAELPWDMVEELLSDSAVSKFSPHLERFGRGLAQLLLSAAALGTLLRSISKFAFDGKQVSDSKAYMV